MYSRYGVEQWSAPLPWVRVVVKDPFALLSVPVVAEVTGARPVVLFRHPAALLASYRRMGWRPDIAEIDALDLAGAPTPAPDPDDDVGSMGWFWATAYRVVLRDLDGLPDAVVVDHAELAAGGPRAICALASSLGLQGVRPVAASPPGSRHIPRAERGLPPLHQLDRNPTEVADEWRRHVSDAEVHHIEALTAPVLDELARRRFRLPTDDTTTSGGARG